jgi:Zn-dependent alcohol dehydrogenase
VGIVREAGEAVTHVKVGDRVGFGYTHEVCGVCDHCLSGMNLSLCPKYGVLLTDFQAGTNTAPTRRNTELTTMTSVPSAGASSGAPVTSSRSRMAMTLPMQLP